MPDACKSELLLLLLSTLPVRHWRVYTELVIFLLFTGLTLRVLDASCNTIGDEGVSLIMEKSSHNTITELRVENCGLSVKSMSIVKFLVDFENSY